MQRNPAAIEPFGDFLDVLLAVGIIDMLPRGKDFDRLHSAAGQSIQNARMQPLFHEQIG